MTTVHSVTTAFIINSICWTFTVNDITPSTSPSSLITISRSQSRITSSTLSTWKNTYSNFNMTTFDQHNDHHHQHDDSPVTIKIFFLNRLWVIIRPATSSWRLQHDDQQLRHRHRYDLRYGHDSRCLPSTDHSTKTTALFSTETAKQNFKRDT